MNPWTKKNKPTVAEQQTKATEKHPRMQLVPDESRQDYPKATDTTCGARRHFGPRVVECELAPLHPGHHSGEGRSWRPDAAAELEAEIEASK